MSGPSETVYAFGEYSLDTRRRLLARAGAPVTLPPKAFDLLVLLVEAGGSVLERDALIRALWPDTFVEEANLTFQVSTLRKALGPDGAKWIETLPKHGYRFAAEVAVVGADSPKAAPGPSSQEAPASLPSRSNRYLLLALGGAALAVAAVLVLLFAPWRRAPDQADSSAPAAAVPLTSYPGSEVEPSLSPDGSQVAFSWNGPKEDNYDIYVKLVGPGEPHRLTTDPGVDGSPAWSPDGRQIAFLRRSAVGNVDRASIYLIPALGGGAERQLAEIGLPSYGFAFGKLAWTPDGKWVAVAGRFSENKPSEIWLISPETGERLRITVATTGRAGGDVGPSFSPDGRSLAFVRFVTHSVGDVYLLPLRPDYTPAGSPIRLTRENRAVGAPCWTADGRRLLYSVGGNLGYRHIQALRIDPSHADVGVEPVQLTQGDQATTVAIGRGGRLVYAREQRDTNLWRLPLSPAGAPFRLSGSSTFDDHTPDFSPDGKRIAFASTRSGTEEIWIANADGSNPLQMTSSGGATTANPRWSRDSRSILFNSRKAGSSDLYLLEVATGAIRRLTDDPAEEYEPRWSRDGQWIYFGSTRSGERQVWRMPAAGGAAAQVTKQGGIAAFESADRSWLFYAKSVERPTSIWKVPVQGGEETKVLDGLSYTFNFAVTARGIYLLALGGEPTVASIDFFDFATGRSATLHRLDRPFWWGFAVAPDERSLVWSQVDSQGSDLMLVEHLR